MKSIRTLLFFLVLVPASRSEAAEHLSVAAAANLVFALDELNAEFRRVDPNVELDVTTGSSGNLVAQIANGAPFDVFLSADMDYPRALVDRGLAEASTLTPFARGKLVIWTLRSDVDLSSIPAAVRHPAARRIAIAHTGTAPYGRAAEEVLRKLDLWEEVRPRLVTGENITQTAQFVATGSADLGFVALSLVLSPRLEDRGHWAEVPPDLYAPIDQGAILTRRGANNPAAARYLDFLRSPAAREIFARFGYAVPASP